MPQTTNKGYEVPTPGTETDTWGGTLNTDTFAVIDLNVGGTVTKTLSSSQVDLSASESQNLIIRLDGTLTDDVLVTTLAVGFQIVENATSGAFDVTFQKNGVGTAVTILQGEAVVVMLGATQGARKAADSSVAFPSGTRVLFQQTTPPAGWTKESSSTYNDTALRFTTSTVGTGGSLAFSSAMASRSITGTVGSTALTTAQMPAHSHDFKTDGSYTPDGSAPQGGTLIMTADGSNNAQVGTVANNIADAGSGQTHTHTLSVNSLNMAIKYADVCIGVKD